MLLRNHYQLLYIFIRLNSQYSLCLNALLQFSFEFILLLGNNETFLDISTAGKYHISQQPKLSNEVLRLKIILEYFNLEFGMLLLS